MPSPFPGMDPYLEGEEWTSFHAECAVEIARQLAPKVAPHYLVRAQRRYVLDVPEDVVISSEAVYPDVGVFRGDRKRSRGNGAAILAAPLRLAAATPERVPHHWIEIHDRKGRQLVTAIELLSPTNKRGQGRREYLDRRRKILSSTAHLMEIDLLRTGQRIPLRDPPPPAQYFVFLSRYPERDVVEAWPIHLDQPLPRAPVPLRKGDRDVELDLQVAFTQVYDDFNYALDLDYAHQPDVPLSASQFAWARKRIRAIQRRG